MGKILHLLFPNQHLNIYCVTWSEILGKTEQGIQFRAVSLVGIICFSRSVVSCNTELGKREGSLSRIKIWTNTSLQWEVHCEKPHKSKEKFHAANPGNGFAKKFRRTVSNNSNPVRWEIGLRNGETFYVCKLILPKCLLEIHPKVELVGKGALYQKAHCSILVPWSWLHKLRIQQAQLAVLFISLPLSIAQRFDPASWWGSQAHLLFQIPRSIPRSLRNSCSPETFPNTQLIWLSNLTHCWFLSETRDFPGCCHINLAAPCPSWGVMPQLLST